MDAKPQRPIRALRLRDENLPPVGTSLPLKSIHQRNKSSPALSSLVQAGGVKFGVKRTAFADVSNTVRNVQTFRDDSAISAKAVLEPARDTFGQENTKPAEFQRPAQRPLSVASIKGFINTFTSNNVANSTKPKLVDVSLDSNLHTNNQRKFLPKKSTIFKEVEIPALIEAPPLHITKSCNEYLNSANQELVPNLTSSDPVSLPPPVPPHHAKTEPSQGDWQLAGSAINTYNDVRSDGARLGSSDGQETYEQGTFDGSEIYQDASAYPAKDYDGSHRVEKVPLTSIPEGTNEAVGPPLPGSDIDEYWEYGLDEAEFEEEGYTTARSLKSRGDYTTGATTIIMAPKMTAKVEKELAAARQLVEESRTADEIEEDESWDTSMVAEYGEEIFDYMRVLEERMRPNPHYMDSQTEVQWSMRSVLMDWLVQVHHRFSLLPETLYLCVNYIDRFLSCKVVSLGKLQLVGATAIFVAAKYEEINCPSVQEIVFMVDGGYTVDEILKAERFMLSMLQFELGWPGPMSFLRRISKADDYDLETRTLAKYFLEVTIMDERFVASIPSFTAAGAHCLARLMLKKGPWTPAHVYYSNYTYSQLRQLMMAMLSCCENPQKHHSAVFDKYGDKRFKRAAFFVQSEMDRGFQLPPVQRDGSTGHRNTSQNWTSK